MAPHARTATAPPAATATPGPVAAAPLSASVLVLVVAAVNLRPAITSVAGVLPDLAGAYHLRPWALTALSTIPVLVLGIVAWLAPAVRTVLGTSRVGVLALAAIAVGLSVRPFGAPGLFLGTVCAAAGIGILGVLLPTLAKHAGSRAGVVTSAYAGAMTGGAALAPAATPFLAARTGSVAVALALWAAPAFLALVVWRLGWRRVAAGRDPAPTRISIRAVLRSSLAVAVVGFFTVQAVIFFGLTAWLPAVYRDRGASAQEAGLVLGLFGLVSVVATLVTPVVAGRLRAQRALGAALSCLGAAGILLVFSPLNGFLAVIPLGLGQGAAFPLALALITLRSGNADVAAVVSAAAHGCGFLLAALGPLAFGFAFAVTGSWSPALLLMAVLALVQGRLAWAAGRPAQIPSPQRPSQ